MSRDGLPESQGARLIAAVAPSAVEAGDRLRRAFTQMGHSVAELHVVVFPGQKILADIELATTQLAKLARDDEHSKHLTAEVRRRGNGLAAVRSVYRDAIEGLL